MPRPSAASRLVLNFSPVRFDDAEITVGCLPYGQDGDQVLKRLREEHNGTHIFRREGSDCILGVPVRANAALLGESATIRLREHPGLAAALIRNALLNRLSELGGLSLGYEPMEVISRKDLLRGCCPPGVVPPEWLGVRLLYEVAIRTICFPHSKPFIAAALNVRTTRLINRTAGQLLEDGLCLEDVYVGAMIPGKDNRIAPRFELLGCVRSVDGPRLRLTDARRGIEVVEANDVWPVKDAFAACLRLVFKERASEIAAALDGKRAALRQGPAQLYSIRRVVDRLRAREYEMLPGVPFSFGPFLDDSVRGFPKFIPAPRPVYIFDETGSRTAKWNDGGLNEHGPYTARVQTLAPPRICVICQKSERVQVDKFLRTFFFQGVRTRPPRNYFDHGICRKYALGTPHFEYFLADGNTAEAYHKACEEALEKHGSGQPWDLALIQIEEGFRQLPHESNPYLIAKFRFQSLQILVQEFNIETARKWGSPLAFCLNNMGLATYAKLGGIPWLLKARSGGMHELIVGLGSAKVGDGRLGQRKRFVGMTTVFGGDGAYHLHNVSRAVPRDEYQTTLLRTLRGAISSVQKAMNWRPGDRVLLVFHAKFKGFRDEEVQAVSDLVSEFGDYDVRHAFVHVSERHPFIAFDTTQDGVRDPDTGRTKAQYAPVRGRCLQLGSREMLLFLTGPHQVKRPEDGTPRPLLLELHRDSSFTDLQYLTEQVYAFACHSWRTFLPTSLPVTIQYPNLIADSLGKLSRLAQWNPDVMLDRIGKTLWFL
jgi:hypothetical protein